MSCAGNGYGSFYAENGSRQLHRYILFTDEA
jgi:hypothetical protein